MNVRDVLATSFFTSLVGTLKWYMGYVGYVLHYFFTMRDGDGRCWQLLIFDDIGGSLDFDVSLCSGSSNCISEDRSVFGFHDCRRMDHNVTVFKFIRQIERRLLKSSVDWELIFNHAGSQRSGCNICSRICSLDFMRCGGWTLRLFHS